MPTLVSINNYYYVRGGAEFVFFAHNELFSSAGWKVAPFCMHHPKNEKSDWQKYFVEEIELGSDYGLIEKISKSVKAIYSREAQYKLDQLIRDVNILVRA